MIVKKIDTIDSWYRLTFMNERNIRTFECFLLKNHSRIFFLSIHLIFDDYWLQQQFSDWLIDSNWLLSFDGCIFREKIKFLLWHFHTHTDRLIDQPASHHYLSTDQNHIVIDITIITHTPVKTIIQSTIFNSI